MARQPQDWNGLMYGNGCKRYHDCFSCPFDECIDGELSAIKGQIFRLLKQGRKVNEIVRVLPVSTTTVYRYLKEAEA